MTTLLTIVADDRLAPGEVVASRYRLERVVGEGGMGVVWAASHVLTGKSCALKFLKGARAADPTSHLRLLHEARAACRVRHRNVAQVHDILELPSGVPFIVMDLLEGEPLSARIRSGTLTLRESLRIVLAVVDAACAAHALGVVHRDLKPDNIFLERVSRGARSGVDENVVVLDFGVAKFVDAVESAAPRMPGQRPSSLTTTASAVGTPCYMAPEQLAGSVALGAPADVWALGIVLFECVTGARPGRDDAGHVAASEVRRLLAAGDAPPALADLLVDMLAADPAARPVLDVVRVALVEVLEAPAVVARARDLVAPRTHRPIRSAAKWGLGAAIAVMLLATARLFFGGAEPAARPTVSVATPPADPAASVIGTREPVVAAETAKLAASVVVPVAKPRVPVVKPAAKPSTSAAPAEGPSDWGLPTRERE